MTDGLVQIGTICTLLDVSRSTVLRWMDEDPTFPQATKIGGRLFWRRAEVAEWIARKFGDDA